MQNENSQSQESPPLQELSTQLLIVRYGMRFGHAVPNYALSTFNPHYLISGTSLREILLRALENDTPVPEWASYKDDPRNADSAPTSVNIGPYRMR